MTDHERALLRWLEMKLVLQTHRGVYVVTGKNGMIMDAFQRELISRAEAMEWIKLIQDSNYRRWVLTDKGRAMLEATE